MRSPRVTVGLPFHNASDTLVAAIASVFAQRFDDWELVLVNDGSSDGALDIARRVRDPRVRVVADGARRGLAARLNEIAASARGELVARMDADDVMHPDRLARQVAYFDAHPAAQIVGTATYTLDASGERITGWRGGALPQSARDVLRNGLFIHPTVTARRSWMLAHPYDESYPRAQDRELWCRVYGSEGVVLLPERLHFYREPARVRLPQYLAGNRMTRRIVLRHGRRLVGPATAAALYVEFALKSLVYRAAAAVRAESRLVSARALPVDPADAAEAAAALATARTARVPGLTH